MWVQFVMAAAQDNPEPQSSDATKSSKPPPRPDKQPGNQRRNGYTTRVVRYGAMSWVGEFTRKPAIAAEQGAKVVIQSDRGIELGECIGPPPENCGGGDLADRIECYVQNSGPDFCRARAGRILRVATEQDLNEQKHLDAHVQEDIAHCAEFAARLELDLKIVTAEHLLGGERIVFYFRSPARVDFRQLVKELAQRHRTRIEMRQVGARDEARLVADYEICGRECCCKNFLKKLRPVNMKMAKLQKSTLDPSKVSGRCGRLRCCLRYEHFGYDELSRRLPRVGSRVGTDSGPGAVIDRQILTQLVTIRTDDGHVVTIPHEEIREFDLPPAPPVAESEGGRGGAVREPRGARSRRGRPERRPPVSGRSPEKKPPADASGPEGAAAGSRFQPGSERADRDKAAAKPPATEQSEPATANGAPAKPDAARRRRRRRRPGKGGAQRRKDTGADG